MNRFLVVGRVRPALYERSFEGRAEMQSCLLEMKALMDTTTGKYEICSSNRSGDGDVTRHGQNYMMKVEIDAECDRLNQEFPDRRFWVEEYQQRGNGVNADSIENVPDDSYSD
jgi:hypothetical protein